MLGKSELKQSELGKSERKEDGSIKENASATEDASTNACGNASTNASAHSASAVNAGINAYDSSYSGCTPLHWAARDGKNDIVKFLIAQKAEVNAGRRTDSPTRKYTPLMDAARSGNALTVKILLNANADVHAKNSSGSTALHWVYNTDSANLKDSVTKPEYLLEAKEDVAAVSYVNRRINHYTIVDNSKLKIK